MIMHMHDGTGDGTLLFNVWEGEKEKTIPSFHESILLLIDMAIIQKSSVETISYIASIVSSTCRNSGSNKLLF